jgi:hypothetical protein
MIRPKIQRRLLMAAAVALAVVSAGRTEAAAPSDREQARDKVAEGVRLLSAHDYARALARFDEAYVLYSSPKLHYNRGLALEGLGRQADAFVAFSRFVDETKDPSPEHLKHARSEIERLKGLIGFLDVSTGRAGAEIRLDGIRVGVSPLAAPVPTEPGIHEVTVRAPEFGPDTVKQVTLNPGERVSVKAELHARSVSPPSVGTTTTNGAGESSAGQPPVQATTGVSGGPEAPGATAEGSWERPAAWTALAISVAAAGFGVYETVAYRNRQSEFDNLSKPDPGDPQKRIALCGADEPSHGTDPRCSSLYDRGQTALTLAIVGYATSAVLGGISAFLFTRGGGSQANPGATAWSCGVGRLSASCRLAF